VLLLNVLNCCCLVALELLILLMLIVVLLDLIWWVSVWFNYMLKLPPRVVSEMLFLSATL